MSVKVTVKMVCDFLHKRIDELEKKKSDLDSQIGDLEDDINNMEEAIDLLERGNTDVCLSEIFLEVPEPKSPAKKKAVKKPVKAASSKLKKDTWKL